MHLIIYCLVLLIAAATSINIQPNTPSFVWNKDMISGERSVEDARVYL